MDAKAQQVLGGSDVLGKMFFGLRVQVLGFRV